MKKWEADDYQLGATIPLGGTARENMTGSWRSTAIPHFMKGTCQECETPKKDCPDFCADCSDSCQRDCLLCWISCPDACIVMRDGEIQGIDLDYCKGCGICALACPRGAIIMVRQN